MQERPFLIILILYSFVIQNNKVLTLSFKQQKSTHLNEALSLIVQENFVQQTRQLLFFVNFNKNTTKRFYAADDIINGVLSDILEHPYKVLYHKEKKFSNLKHNEIIILDNMKTFKKFYRRMRDIGNLDLTRTVLFMPSLTTLDEKVMQQIFTDYYYMEIINVALIVMLENGDIFMLTYFHFTQDGCRGFKPVIINRFLADQHRWEMDNYFPYKLDNFFDCPIYICTWEQMPYFGVKRSRENNNTIDYVGLEAEILKFAAASLNASIKIRWIDPVNGDVENQESIFTELFLQQCDLAVGGFPYRRDFDKTAFSQTRFFLFSHIFIVTNIIKFYTAYDKLAFPFDYTVWLALGLTFAFSFLLISICGWQRQWSGYRNFLIGPTNRTPHFHLYALAVGSTMTNVHIPKRNFARFLLTCWLLLTFILRNAYQSGMYQMLRDNKQWNPPQTIENVFEQNYLISTTPKYEKFFEVLPHTTRRRIFNATVLEAFAEMLTAKEPIALIVPYEYYGYLGKVNSTLWQNLHLVRERLLTQQLTIYSPHHSFLIPLLNKKLSYGQFHGFISMWSHKTILSIPTALKYEHITEFERTQNKNSNKNLLTMNELGAIFMILIWLHILAVAVFLIELIWRRYENALRDCLF